MTRLSSTLVLGVGNVLMGDEGVGVHAVRALESDGAPPCVTVVDGGTGGFHLLSLLQEYDPVVFVDATLDGRPPGTVTLLKPRFASDFPRVLSAHDIGLRDLLESASLLGPLPRLYLFTVSVELGQDLSLELTGPVRAALPTVLTGIRTVLADLS